MLLALNMPALNVYSSKENSFVMRAFSFATALLKLVDIRKYPSIAMDIVITSTVHKKILVKRRMALYFQSVAYAKNGLYP